MQLETRALLHVFPSDSWITSLLQPLTSVRFSSWDLMICKCNGPLLLFRDQSLLPSVPSGFAPKGKCFAHRNGDTLEMEVVTIELHVALGQAETAWPAVDVWTLLLRYSCIPKKCFTLRRRAAPSLDKIWHFTASALTHTKMITCHRVLGMLKRERKNKKQHRKGKRASKGCTVHYRG